MGWPSGIANYQIIQAPFGMGQDRKTDKLTLPLGKLQLLQNGWFDTSGDLTKRYGAVKLASGGGTGIGLAAFRSELLKITSTGFVDTFDPLGQTWNAVPVGGSSTKAPVYKATRSPLRRNVAIPPPGPTGMIEGAATPNGVWA